MERMNTAMRQRRSRSDEIYDALRQMIVTAQLPPGAALVERDLCTLFSASQSFTAVAASSAAEPSRL